MQWKNTSPSQQRSLLQVGDLRSLENSTKLLIVCIPAVNRLTVEILKYRRGILRIFDSPIWNALPNHLSSILTLIFLLLEELSNITYSSLITLTVMQNLVRSNQLNVSHFVIQRQLLPLHRPETPCRSSKDVPSERLRLVEVINFA